MVKRRRRSPRCLHPLADHPGGLTAPHVHSLRSGCFAIAQLLVIHPRHLDVARRVDPPPTHLSSEPVSQGPGGLVKEASHSVQQRPRQPLLVAPDCRHVAGALVLGISEPTAGTWVHSAHNHEIGGKAQRPLWRLMVTTLSTRGWRSVSKFLVPNSDNSSKNNTPRCARLTPAPPQVRVSPGLGRRPPPQSGVADGVMRRAEGPLVDQRRIRGQLASH